MTYMLKEDLIKLMNIKLNTYSKDGGFITGFCVLDMDNTQYVVSKRNELIWTIYNSEFPSMYIIIG